MIKKIILYILLGVSIFGACYSIYNIIGWYIDNQKTKEQIERAQEFLQIDSIDNNSESSFSVDFSSLLQENNEAKGWIIVDNTNINYPFVQHDNNSYYLNHSFNKSINDAGWIFLDYRNSINSLDVNTIIYGHGRLDETMFGSLKNILEVKNANCYIYLYLPSANYTFRIFSSYHIDTTDDYLKTKFNSTDEYAQFLEMITNRSNRDFKVNVNTNDKILTLSTCYNDKEKMVVHAKMIKEEYLNIQ